MRVKIRVGSTFLETFSNTDDLFYVTEQVYDLKALENRKANYTRELQVPRTDINSNVLNLQSNERLDNPSYSCVVLLDDITFFYGNIIVTSFTDVTISLIIFAGNFDLFESLPNKSVKDLNLNAYSFPWTQAGISAQKTNTDGCTSCNTNFFDLKTLDDGTGVVQNFTNSWDIKNWGFAFYYKTLVTEILSQSGYTVNYDANLAADDLFLDLVIPCPVILPGSQEDIVAGVVDRTTDYVYDASILLGIPDRISFVDSTGTGDPNNMWNGTNDEWVLPISGEWTVIFDYTVTVTGNADLGPAEISLLVNGQEQITRQWYSGTTNVYDRIVFNFTANAGDLIYIEAFAESRNPSRYDVLTIFTGAQFFLQQNIPDPTGNLYPQDWLPDINQNEALMGFLKVFNALIIANPFSKQATIIRYIDYIKATAQDLSNNLTTDEIEYETSIATYYKQSLLTYNNDRIDRTDTDKQVDFNDALLQQRGTILSQLFSGSDDDGTNMEVEAASMSFRTAQNFSFTTGTNIFSFGQLETFKVGDYLRYQGATSVNDEIHRIRFTGPTGGQTYNNFASTQTNVDVQIIEIRTNDIIPRLAMIDRGQSIGRQLFTRVNGYTGTTVLVDVNVIIFTPITWEKLEDEYYKPLFDAVRTAKIVYAWMKFDTLEFYNIDYSRPCYIKQLNGTFHINKLEQYKLNQLCRVELIRINQIV